MANVLRVELSKGGERRTLLAVSQEPFEDFADLREQLKSLYGKDCFTELIEIPDTEVHAVFEHFHPSNGGA